MKVFATGMADAVRPKTQFSPGPNIEQVGRCDAVIVLSYFGRQDTMRCIGSLVSGSPSARLLVIDNGSFDGVLEASRSRWPQVETIQTGCNLGFSGGMNVGLKWAHSIGADTITVLNNDTIIPAGAIDALAEAVLGGGAVSPVIRYADGEHRVWFGGGVVDSASNLPRHLNDVEIAEKFADTPEHGLRVVETLAGCCITATAVTWLKVGQFDERYFLNFEDSDWSVRAGRVGVSLLVDPRTVIYHRVSASFTGAYSYLGSYYYTRNGLLFGRSSRDGGLAGQIRFLRRHVLPSVLGDFRNGHVRESSRRALMVALAVGADCCRRYGRAPRGVETLAVRWGTPIAGSGTR